MRVREVWRLMVRGVLLMGQDTKKEKAYVD